MAYMRKIPMAVMPVAALICMSAWGQATPSDGAGDSIAPTPSAAAAERTPGTPGASDTPGAVQARSNDTSIGVSSSSRKIAALKKQAAKDSRKNAADAAKAGKTTSSAPPK
jgi:hypothetical protein